MHFKVLLHFFKEKIYIGGRSESTSRSRGEGVQASVTKEDFVKEKLENCVTRGRGINSLILE